MVLWMKTEYQKHQRAVKELVLYGMIGGGTSMLDTVCYLLFTRTFAWNKFFSNVCSVHIGILSSFLLNTYFNFRKTDQVGKRAVSFYLVGCCGMGLSMILLYIGTEFFACSDIVIKISAIFVVALFQFVLNKCITYSKI